VPGGGKGGSAGGSEGADDNEEDIDLLFRRLNPHAKEFVPPPLPRRLLAPAAALAVPSSPPLSCCSPGTSPWTCSCKQPWARPQTCPPWKQPGRPGGRPHTGEAGERTSQAPELLLLRRQHAQGAPDFPHPQQQLHLQLPQQQLHLQMQLQLQMQMQQLMSAGATAYPGARASTSRRRHGEPPSLLCSPWPGAERTAFGCRNTLWGACGP